MAFTMCCCPLFWYHLLSHWAVSCCSEQVLAGVFTYIPTLKFLYTVQLASWHHLIPACALCKSTLEKPVFIIHSWNNILIVFPSLKAFFKGGELQFGPMKNSFEPMSVVHCCCKNFCSQSDLAVFEMNSPSLPPSFLFFLVLPSPLSSSFLPLPLISKTGIHSLA